MKGAPVIAGAPSLFNRMLTIMPMFPRVSWLALAALLVVFHIGLVFYGLVPNLVSRPLHLALILPWAFVFGARFVVPVAFLAARGLPPRPARVPDRRLGVPPPST